MDKARKVVHLTSAHPLVGTWGGEGDDARAEYTVSAHGATFKVSGKDAVDGERFTISDVNWDGKILRFTSFMPSTGRIVVHTFRLLADDKAEHEYTLTDSEIWSKKKAGLEPSPSASSC